MAVAEAAAAGLRRARGALVTVSRMHDAPKEEGGARKAALLAASVFLSFLVCIDALGLTLAGAGKGDGLPEWCTESFVDTCLEIQDKTGFSAAVCIAQAQIEVGGTWDGASLYDTAAVEHNFFGLTVAGTGDSFAPYGVTWDGKAGKSGIYRKYASDEQGLWDRARLLAQSSAYSDVLAAAKKRDTYAEAAALSTSPWCENGYGTMLEDIIGQFGLTRLDGMHEGDAKRLFERTPATGAVPTGAEYRASSPSQKAIVQTAMSVGSPGGGWCSAWVDNVYAAAGYVPKRCGTAFQQWKACGQGSTGAIPVGAAVYGTGQGSDGCGHVGIYIGDGRVMDNQGPFGGPGRIVTSDLETWISWQTDTIEGHRGYLGWGWPNGRSLA